MEEPRQTKRTSIVPKPLRRGLTPVSENIGAIGFFIRKRGKSKVAFLSDSELTIGADRKERPEHYFLPGAGIKDVHAKITFDYGGAKIESKGDIIANRSSLSEGDVMPIRKGSRIRIGEYTLDVIFLKKAEPSPTIYNTTGSPLLTIFDIEEGTKRFVLMSPLDKSVVFGKDPKATVCLDGQDLSPFHAAVGYDSDGSLIIQDRQKGTRVDGVDIKGAKKRLVRGSLFEVGGRFAVTVDLVENEILDKTEIVDNQSDCFASYDVFSRSANMISLGTEFLKSLKKMECDISSCFDDWKKRDLARVYWSAFIFRRLQRIPHGKQVLDEALDIAYSTSELIKIAKQTTNPLSVFEGLRNETYSNRHLNLLVTSSILLAPKELRASMKDIESNRTVLVRFTQACKKGMFNAVNENRFHSLVDMVPSPLVNNESRSRLIDGLSDSLRRRAALAELNSILNPYGMAINIAADGDVMIGKARKMAIGDSYSLILVQSIPGLRRFFMQDHFKESAGAIFPGMILLAFDHGILKKDSGFYHSSQHFIDELSGYRDSALSRHNAHTDTGRAFIEATAIASELLLSDYADRKITGLLKGNNRSKALKGGCALLQKHLKDCDSKRKSLLGYMDDRYEEAGAPFTFSYLLSMAGSRHMVNK